MSTSQRLRVRFAGLAALLMIGTATASAQQWEDRIGFGSLFVAAEPPRRVWKTGTAAAVLRERFVRLDQDVLEAARVNAGRADLPPTIVRLTLFDDVVLNAVVERTGPSSSGYWLSGRIEEWPLLGSITLAVNGRCDRGNGAYAGGDVCDPLRRRQHASHSPARSRRTPYLRG